MNPGEYGRVLDVRPQVCGPSDTITVEARPVAPGGFAFDATTRVLLFPYDLTLDRLITTGQSVGGYVVFQLPAVQVAGPSRLSFAIPSQIASFAQTSGRTRFLVRAITGLAFAWARAPFEIDATLSAVVPTLAVSPIGLSAMTPITVLPIVLGPSAVPLGPHTVPTPLPGGGPTLVVGAPPGPHPSVPTSVASPPPVATGTPAQDFDLARTTKEHYENWIRSRHGVHAVGVGAKGAPGSRVPAVLVVVERVLPSSALHPSQLIPRALPAHDGHGRPVAGLVVPTDVEAGGPFTTSARTGRVRPLEPGYGTSVVNPQGMGTGTIGAALADASQVGAAVHGASAIPVTPLSASALLQAGHGLFFLTCSHVVNRAPQDQQTMLQPGQDDGGQPADAVGRPDRWTNHPQLWNPAVVWADAAAVVVDAVIKAQITGIGRIAGEHVLTGGDVVAGIGLQKSGRTTLVTRGVLKALHTTVGLITGPFTTVDYYEQAFVAGQGAPFSEHGDSGSLVLTSSNLAAGVVIGDDGGKSIVTPIRLALVDLNHPRMSTGTAGRHFVLVQDD
jgi:hypothetical protein